MHGFLITVNIKELRGNAKSLYFGQPVVFNALSVERLLTIKSIFDGVGGGEKLRGCKRVIIWRVGWAMVGNYFFLLLLKEGGVEQELIRGEELLDKFLEFIFGMGSKGVIGPRKRLGMRLNPKWGEIILVLILFCRPETLRVVSETGY